jgi:hypothetical protein
VNAVVINFRWLFRFVRMYSIRASVAIRLGPLEIAVLTSPTTPSAQDFERVASAGPKGALALCGTAVAIVVGIWLAFYFFAFLPRGLLQ